MTREPKAPVAEAQKLYMGQCDRCFIVSGRLVSNTEDLPSCCGGEQMSAVEVIPWMEECAKEGDDL